MVLQSARKSIQWIDFSEEGHGSGSDERSDDTEPALSHVRAALSVTSNNAS